MDVELFVGSPIDEIRRVAPASLVLGAGGTRRRAALDGVPLSKYASSTRDDMISCFDMIFRHGIHHLFAPLLIEGSQAEATAGYSEKLVEWIRWGLAGADTMAAFAKFNWRIRLLGSECWPGLEALAEELQSATAQHSGPTVWFSVISKPELHWETVLRRVVEHNAFTREDAVRAVYGEDIPPITLYVGTGKPEIVASAVPPLLIGNMQCYWRQHLSYDLDQDTFRRILFDYAYTRRTWQRDKSGRAEQAVNFRAAWEDPPVIGLGFRLGPFWYPAPFSLPPQIDREHEKWIYGQ